jgi:hypothetical protein
MKAISAFAMMRDSVDGHTYIDISTISHLREFTQEKANTIDKDCGPTWVRDNKQVKIIKISIENIDDR